MENALLWIGRLAAMAGVALVAVAAVVRLGGAYWLGGFQMGTLMLGGIAGMLIGCLCLLSVLVSRTDRAR
jgi:hypothetical protein